MTNALDFVFEESRPPAPVADHVTDELLRQRAVAIRGSARSLPRLADAPELEYLWISGVNPRAAETVAQLSRLHRLVIHDYRLRDLKPIDSLVNLESLMICGRSFMRSLAGLESLMRLKRLLLFQLTDYRTIEPVAALRAIETLCLQGAWAKNLRIDTLQPIASLSRLHELCLAEIRVADKSLRPLHDLHRLQRLFIADAFPRQEFLALSRALQNVRGEWLDTCRSPNAPRRRP